MRRWLKRILITLVCFVVPAAAFYFYAVWQGERELRAVIAELDAKGEPWRWDELAAARTAPPVDQEIRAVMLKVREMVPRSFYASKAVERVHGQPSVFAFTPEDAAALDESIEPNREAIAEARKLANMPLGRLHVDWPANVVWPNFEDLQKCREFVNVLSAAAAWDAQHGDLDAALVDCLAMQRLCQALGEEWTAIAALVRIALQAIAANSLERVLAQTHPTKEHAAALARLQQAWEQFDDNRALKIAFLGERAGTERIYQSLGAGKQSLKDLMDPRGRASPWETAVERLQFFNLKSAQAWTLRHFTDMDKVFDLPEPERGARWRELEQEARRAPGIARLLTPALQKVCEAQRRGACQLRCAIAALAAERFRIDEGRWPLELAELTPKYLAKIPDDPYATAPLRLRPTGDGVVIYSVGPDGKGTGNYWEERAAKTSVIRYEFRLWDVNRRRQPAVEQIDR